MSFIDSIPQTHVFGTRQSRIMEVAQQCVPEQKYTPLTSLYVQGAHQQVTTALLAKRFTRETINPSTTNHEAPTHSSKATKRLLRACHKGLAQVREKRAALGVWLHCSGQPPAAKAGRWVRSPAEDLVELLRPRLKEPPWQTTDKGKAQPLILPTRMSG